MWKHFKYEDFACPCCRRNNTHPELIDKLDKAQELLKFPLVIKLGYICESYAKRLNSFIDLKLKGHLEGRACKIVCIDNFSRFLIISALLKVGFEHIGISEKFVHCEIPTNEIIPKSFWILDRF